MPLTGGEIRAVLRKLDTDGSGSVDYKELLSFAKQPPTASSTTDGDSADGNIMSRLVSSTSKLLGRGAASPSKSPAKKSSKEQQHKHKSKKHNKDSDDEDSSGAEEDGDAPAADVDSDVADASGKQSKKGGKKASTTAVLRGLKARVAAVSRAAATAAATAARDTADAEAEHSGSDDDADVARRRVTLEDTGPDWDALFAAQDPDETGTVLVRSAAVAFEEGGVPLSELELTAVSARFASTDSNSNNSNSIAMQPIVKWLVAAARAGTASAASGSALDDATLRRIQKHVRGRLGRAFDLRALCQEMSGGRGYLTGKSLSKGLRRAGLKVDKAVATELVQRFDRDCDGRLEYTEFQRLVHAAGLAELDNPVSPMARAR
jgi:EF-hand domain pair